MSDGYECFACKRKIEKVGESEIASGWNKFQGRAGIGNSKQSLTVVHCPDHKAGFLDAIQKALEKEIETK